MQKLITQYHQMFAVGWMLAKRSLLIEIRTSRLGWLWPLIYPIAYTGLFLALKPFAHTPERSGADYALYVFVGLSLWQLWYEGLNTQMRAMKAQKSLLSRADLDTTALFLSGLMVQVVYLLPRLAVALAFAATFGHLDSFLAAFLFVALSIFVVFNGAVIGFVLQPFATLLPDVVRVVQSISLALMLTGGIFVIFPPDMSIEMRTLLALNPLGPLVDAARAPLLAHAPYFESATWVWVVLTVIALAIQVRLSRKVLPVLLERIGS